MGRRLPAQANGPETVLLRTVGSAIFRRPTPSYLVGVVVPRSDPVSCHSRSRPAGPGCYPSDRHLVSATRVESATTRDVESFITTVHRPGQRNRHMATSRGGVATFPGCGTTIAESSVLPAGTPEHLGAAGCDVPGATRTAATTVRRILTTITTGVLAPRASHLTRTAGAGCAPVEDTRATVPDTGRVHGLGATRRDVPRRCSTVVPPVRPVRPIVSTRLRRRHSRNPQVRRVRVLHGGGGGTFRYVRDFGDHTGRPVTCESRRGPYRVIRDWFRRRPVRDFTDNAGRR